MSCHVSYIDPQNDLTFSGTLQVIIKKFCIIVSTKHYQAKTDFFLPYHEGKKACVPDLKRGKDTTDQSAVLSSRAG